jgi:predicted RNA-binding Zn ribbon-like protein
LYFEGYTSLVINSNLMCDAPPPRRFQFVGGDLALDFTNTMGGKRAGIAREYLHTYTDFLSWCSQAGLVDNLLAEDLAVQAARCPEEAASVLARAIEVREAIYRIFAAVVENRTASAEDIGLLNRELAAGLHRLCVAAGKGKTDFGWAWTRDGCALDQPLGPVARAAADLLISHTQLNHVHLCDGDNCGWLFVDSSKNHSRRWCDMRDCGNRAKVRRHRLKQGPKKD